MDHWRTQKKKSKCTGRQIKKKKATIQTLCDAANEF